MPRSAVADVYKFIITDLQYAIANLPASYSGVDIGRATKYAAEATLASAIAGGNVHLLESIKGIGKKTADRLVLELKDKVGIKNR